MCADAIARDVAHVCTAVGGQAELNLYILYRRAAGRDARINGSETAMHQQERHLPIKAVAKAAAAFFLNGKENHPPTSLISSLVENPPRLLLF